MLPFFSPKGGVRVRLRVRVRVRVRIRVRARVTVRVRVRVRVRVHLLVPFSSSYYATWRSLLALSITISFCLHS